MAVLRGAAGWIIRQAAAMQAAAGGRRWWARPPRWRRWRLRCCCEVWQGWQAVGAVQVGQGWRWCVVIVGGGLLLAGSSGAALAVLILPGAGGGAISMRRVQRSPGTFQLFPGAAQHPARAGLLIRQAGQAGRRRKRKRPGRRRVVRCCSGLLSALAVRSAAPGAPRCISWAVVVCSPFRCRAAGAGTDPGATVPAAPDPAARPALAVLHPVRFCPAAGGVRFSTLPGSALGVGLELSEL